MEKEKIEEVFDTLSKEIVFRGTIDECRQYIKEHDHGFLTIKLY